MQEFSDISKRIQSTFERLAAAILQQKDGALAQKFPRWSAKQAIAMPKVNVLS